MLEEIALHVLDIALNAIRADATQITINIREDLKRDQLTLVVGDDGCGLDAEQLDQIWNDYYTTKTDRPKKIGLGIALLRQTAEMNDGRFYILSQKGKGTQVVAMMRHSHIDRPPLGDMATVIWELIVGHPHVDLRYIHTRGRSRCTFDTRLVRKVLEVSQQEAGEVFQIPEISGYIRRDLTAGEAQLEQQEART